MTKGSRSKIIKIELGGFELIFEASFYSVRRILPVFEANLKLVELRGSELKVRPQISPLI